MIIYIVEGEKDAENLRKLNLSAITNCEGSIGKWNDSYSAAFRRASIVIIADKDVPGRKHAMQAARSLYGKAAHLKLIELPDREGRQVENASDWLAAGGTKEELKQLCNKEKEWSASGGVKEDNMVHIIHMADVQSESLEWLWYPYLPKSKLTLMEGDPGVGKSWVSLAIAAAISPGKGLPGQESSKPASVLLASAEDGPGDTIRPRLNALGAHIENIHAIEGPLSLDDEGLGTLEKFIQDLHPALIIIDPLVGAS